MATPNILGLTTIRPIALAGQQLPNSETALYTVGAGKAAKLATAVLANPTASPVTVSLSLVRSGGSAEAANRLISGFVLAAGDSLPLVDYLGGAFLNEGDFISAIAGTAAAVAFTLTGTELS